MDVSLASPFSALPYTPFNNNTLSRSPSQTADLSSTQAPSLLNFSQSSDDFTMDLSMPSPSQKWKEITTDVLPTFTAPPSPSKQPTKRRKSIPTLTASEKLELIFDFLKKQDWTLGEFLHHTFAHKDDRNGRIPRSQRHGIIVKRFLSGQNKYTVSGILESWFTSPDGYGHNAGSLMYCVTTPYTQILT